MDVYSFPISGTRRVITNIRNALEYPRTILIKVTSRGYPKNMTSVLSYELCIDTEYRVFGKFSNFNTWRICVKGQIAYGFLGVYSEINTVLENWIFY